MISVSIILPLLAAAFALRSTRIAQARNVTLAALAATLALSAWTLTEVLRGTGGFLPDSALRAWLAADNLSAVLMVLFPALALVTVAAAPQRDTDRHFLAITLAVVSATLTTYAARNNFLMLAAWTTALLPCILGSGRRGWPTLSRCTLGASCVALAVAFAVGGSGVGLVALVLAAILRTGLFPAHRGVAATLGGSGLLPSALVMNSFPGLYLLARMVVPQLAAEAPHLLPWLGVLALLSCLLMAILALAEKTVEGLLASVFVSQACALFAGLTTRTPEGITGALLQWLVLAICSTVMLSVYRALHARTDGDIAGSGFNGFAAAAPRFAVLFALAALALAGLPGTLGFSGEDLLMHGALVAHGWFGVVLPVAIALNAWHVYRLFAVLFMGEPRIAPVNLRDALPRERLSLFAALAILIWLGLVPGHAVQLRDPAVRLILGSEPAVTSSLP